MFAMSELTVNSATATLPNSKPLFADPLGAKPNPSATWAALKSYNGDPLSSFCVI
jgi:hypothetical protein